MTVRIRCISLDLGLGMSKYEVQSLKYEHVICVQYLWWTCRIHSVNVVLYYCLFLQLYLISSASALVFSLASAYFYDLPLPD